MYTTSKNGMTVAAACSVMISSLLSSCAWWERLSSFNAPVAAVRKPEVRETEFYKVPGRPGGNLPEVAFMLDPGPTPLSSGTRDEEWVPTAKSPTVTLEELQFQKRANPLVVTPVRLAEEGKLRRDSKGVAEPYPQDSPSLEQANSAETIASVRLPKRSRVREHLKDPSNPSVQFPPASLVGDPSLGVFPPRSLVRSEMQELMNETAQLPRQGNSKLPPGDISTEVAPAPIRKGSVVEAKREELTDSTFREVLEFPQVKDSVTNFSVQPSKKIEVQVNSMNPPEASEQFTGSLEDTDTPLYAALAQIPEEVEDQVGFNGTLGTATEEASVVTDMDVPRTIGTDKSRAIPVHLAKSRNTVPVPANTGPIVSKDDIGLPLTTATTAPGAIRIADGERPDSHSSMTLAATDPDAPEALQNFPAESRVLDPERLNVIPGLDVRISVDLRQMDILAVMKFLAKEGNLNIVTGKNVGGRISLTLKDVTVLDILDIIALSYELAYVVQNGIIHVMTEADYTRLFGAPFADQRKVRTLQLENADANAVAALLNNMKSAVGRVIGDPQTRTLILIDVPEKLEPMVTAAENMDRATKLQTQVFELRYGKAEDIQPEVEKVLTPNTGGVRLDKRTNTLVVTDLAPRMNEVQRVIRAFDRQTREVNIESKIVQVRLDDKFQMGVNWEVLFQQLSDLRLQGTFPISPAVGAAGPVGRLTVGTLADDDFTAVIELLQSVGKTNVLSTPQIAVVENEEAKILVGTREAFVTSVVTQTQQAATTAEEVTFVDVGVSLTATPSINREGYVTMKIKPEVSSVTRTLTTASGNQIPIVQTSTAESTVMVKDGVTIIIAGLIEDQSLQTTNKVPILGDIPILGAAFRNREDEVIKSELVIFLTPTIISGKESIASVPPAAP